jgi:hypothetical protein
MKGKATTRRIPKDVEVAQEAVNNTTERKQKNLLVAEAQVSRSKKKKDGEDMCTKQQNSIKYFQDHEKKLKLHLYNKEYTHSSHVHWASLPVETRN